MRKAGGAICFTERKSARGTSVVLLILIIICVVSECFLSYSLGYMTAMKKVDELETQVQKIQGEITNLRTALNNAIQNSTYYGVTARTLSQLYEHVRNSVVTVKGVVVQHDLFATRYIWVS